MATTLAAFRDNAIDRERLEAEAEAAARIRRGRVRGGDTSPPGLRNWMRAT
jgi:hypothetical protein